jgi:hypothetical protein
MRVSRTPTALVRYGVNDYVRCGALDVLRAMPEVTGARPA